jgi:hypothetical protein
LTKIRIWIGINFIIILDIFFFKTLSRDKKNIEIIIFFEKKKKIHILIINWKNEKKVWIWINASQYFILLIKKDLNKENNYFLLILLFCNLIFFLKVTNSDDKILRIWNYQDNKFYRSIEPDFNPYRIEACTDTNYIGVIA